MILKNNRLKAIGIFLGWSAIFAILYAQSPLYLSNQNTYFLHGLAQAGLGNLESDWLANTADPTPVFSGLVYLTYLLTKSGAPFYVYYALLMGVYLYSMTGIFDLFFGFGHSKAQKLFFTAIFLGLHSAALRFVLSRFVDADATFMLEGGLGNQRILGQVLQPSVFGVFLVLSIYFFLRKKDWRAIPPLAAAVYFHPTYLTGAALITIGYLWILWRDKKSFHSIFLFAFATLGTVLPVVIYTFLVFGPSSPESFQQAQQILITFRVPHHAIVSQWFNWTSMVQLTLIACGLIITRKTILFPLYAIMSAGAFLLSIIQIATGSNTLALLFPWRISVILVPLGATSLAALLTNKLFNKPTRFEKLLLPGSLILIGLLMTAGSGRFLVESARQNAQPERTMMTFVATHKSADDIYLIPPKMQDFRLVTGAAVWADFKSNPYRDTDVLEWYRRVQRINDFYNNSTPSCQSTTELITFAGANHIVLPVEKSAIVCDNLATLYQDEYYTILGLE